MFINGNLLFLIHGIDNLGPWSMKHSTDIKLIEQKAFQIASFE